MGKKATDRPRSIPWIFLIMLASIAWQTAIVWSSSIRPWLGPIYRYGLISAFQRGQIMNIGFIEAKYIRFLEAYIPKNAPVVIPNPPNAAFSDQNLMQFYLFPRRIWGCGNITDVQCRDFVMNPDAFVLAVNDFPPTQMTVGKVFVPFPEPYNNIRGIYVPQMMADRLAVPGPEVYDRLQTIPLQAPLIEIGVLLLFFMLGAVFVSLVLPRPTWLDLLGLSLPLAMGSLSWTIFLTSYLGIPITRLTVSLCFVLVLATGVTALLLLHRRFATLSVWASIDSFRRLWKHDRIALLLGLGMLTWLGLGILVAVGSTYTNYDAITNWYMKGFVMAAQHTIWAGDSWGGHVLAYPMNIQLSTAIFGLADGDQLPGSKFLFPLLAFSLVLGCCQFLRRHGVDRKASIGVALMIFTVPLFFNHAINGMANIPFTIYLILGTLWSFDGFRSRNVSWVLMGGILLAFSAWTRPEGIGFCLAMLAVIYAAAVLGMKVRRLGKYLAASLLPILVFPVTWLGLLGIREMRHDQIGTTLQGFFTHWSDGTTILRAIGQISAYALDYSGEWRTTGFLVIISLAVLLLALILRRGKNQGQSLWMLVVTAVAWLLPAVMFFPVPFTTADFAAFLQESFNRAYLPAIVLLAVTAFVYLLGEEESPSNSARPAA